MKRLEDNVVIDYIASREFEHMNHFYMNSKLIITIKDKHGYMYETSWGDFRAGKTPTLAIKSNPYSIQNIKLWCKNNNRPFVVLDETYISSSYKMKVKCLDEKCGEIFEYSWDKILAFRGCPCCSGRKVCASNCLETKYPEISAQIHPTLNNGITGKDITCGSHKDIYWQCEKDPSHIWNAKVSDRTVGKGCPFCSGRNATKEDNFLVKYPELAKFWNYNKNSLLPNQLKPRSNKHFWFICPECNYEWYSSLSNIAVSCGCPMCNKSKGEKRIYTYLFKNEINNNKQHMFDGLVGIGGLNLSYDFYLPDLNLLIEYQGEFHDRQVYDEHNFKRQQEHDKRKRDYAKDNNIELLEIWYWDFDNIESILDNYIKRK